MENPDRSQIGGGARITMLDEIEKAPSAESALSEMSSAGCLDNSEIIKPPRQNTQQENLLRNPRAVAAVIKDLNAEYACEAAHIASVYARHFVEDMEIGDVWSAEHDMRGAVLHLREAAARFREWQGKPLPAREGGQ
jgi:hypothetical protein